jgi:putative transposase
MAQIPSDAELANANLQYLNGNFYLLVTCYLPKTADRRRIIPKRSVGIDGGIAHQLTLSNGIQIQYGIPISKKLRKLYRRLARCTYGSKNYVKCLRRLRQYFIKWTNQKQDTINQIVHLLTQHYQLIAFQKDPLKAWQRIWGRRTLNTALGKLFTTLEKRAVIPIPINQWEPTTKRCSECQMNLPKALPLNQRVFICPNPKCGVRMGRDLNGSTTMEKLGTGEFEPINSEIPLPVERWEPMPPEANTSIRELQNRFHRLPYVSAQVLPVKEEATSFLSESESDPIGSRAW